MLSLCEWIVRQRYVLLTAALVAVCWSAYLATTLKLYDDPNRWPPESDPAVVLNEQLQRKFGGANMVTIMIARTDGRDVVQADTLAKVKRITDELLRVHGVIPYAVRSLSAINSRYLAGTAEELDASLLFNDPNRAPETPEELDRVRRGIENNAALKHGLVSKDGQAVIIQADFRTGLQDVRAGLDLPVTDPIAIYRAINRIIEPENDAAHKVTAAGSPTLIGWVNSDGLPYIAFAFGIVALGIAVVLIFAFRSLVGVLPPLILGIVASTYAFGLQRLIEGEVLTSSAALLAPFIIMAVAASHGTLFVKRLVTDELDSTNDLLPALRDTLAKMATPLVVTLATDLIAFVVLAFVPFDNVRVLGQVTAFGLLAIVLSVPCVLIPMLALMPSRSVARASAIARARRDSASGIIYKTTAMVVRPLIYSKTAQTVVLGIAGLLTCAALSVWIPVNLLQGTSFGRFLASEITTGQDNTYAVHNYLTQSWETNSLYQMEQEITQRFGGVYTFAILAKGREPGAVKTPETLVALEALATHLERHDEVSAVVGLPFYVKIMNRFLNEDRDEAFRIPTEGRAQMAVNEALYFLTSGMPGAFDFVVDPDFQNTALIAFVRDTSPATVTKLVDDARDYIDLNWDSATLNTDIELPAGNVGIADAFNRSIKKWMIYATVLSAVASFVAAGLMLRSVVGPFLLMVPLIGGTIIWIMLMHLIGIEFNSNVTAALAIASGVGIDAEVYLLYRFREEYPKHRDFRRALLDAFTLVREPLVFSFAALFAGCLAVSGVPLYVGYVGFSMALVLLTTFLFSFFVAPVVWSVLQPKFLTRGLDCDGDQPPAAESIVRERDNATTHLLQEQA
jgi:predicted RND superfamily exporter protein